MQVSKPVRYGILFLVLSAALGMLWLGLDRYWAEQEAVAYASGPEPMLVPAPVLQVESEPKAPAEPPKPTLLVHVAGAVVQPGVYRFEQGARVVDAIDAAGGPLPDGVADALNLAATLSDGDKLYVPTVQELKAQALPGPAAAGATKLPVTSVSGGSGQAGGAAGGDKVNINTATAAELEKVSGIGPATARAIIEYRSKNGPFPDLESLTGVSGIGAKTLEKLRPQLTH